ncbi:hypothetical protein CVIRNUC_004682 [Coccomyxa viridis]|uniref:Uncharacterized protein n=1 Tax=Coccomyxa viridis TaxID=1274662 RepID=A0AAV1I427_9CHLO|nr:hypothetical protein CVIRNUC_004682 [Coccomyxa viridis]
MMAAMKIVFLLAVAVLAFLMVTDARRLLDYDDCHRGWNEWNNGHRGGDYECGGRRWDRDGRWYDGRDWRGGRDGFCVGLCG